jgi:peptidoglycan/xylan/chitin deacetylase (PgdA/CDA1 family)
MERVARRGRCLLIWNYHRLATADGNPFDDGVLDATPAVFQAEVEYLRDHFTVLSLDDLLRSSGAPLHLSRPCAMVTLDDGYCDAFSLALPILRRVGVTATFFVATGYIGESVLPWWDQIAYVVKKTNVTRLTLEYPEPLTIDLRETPRAEAIDRLLRLWKRAIEPDEDMFLHHLQDRGQVVLAPGLARGLFMSWDQCRQLVAEGMAIGSHTHSHSVLSALTEDDRAWEFTYSKALLEARLGCPIRAVSYPIGGRLECDDVTKRLAREAGYRLGFSYYGGANFDGHNDLLDIRRMAVDRDMSFTLFRVRSTLLSAIGVSV